MISTTITTDRSTVEKGSYLFMISFLEKIFSKNKAFVTQNDLAQLEKQYEEQKRTIDQLQVKLKQKKKYLEGLKKAEEEAEKKAKEEAVARKLKNEQEHKKTHSNHGKVKKEDDFPPNIMIPVYKDKLVDFYEAHKHELQPDEYTLIVRQFARIARRIETSNWRSTVDGIFASKNSNVCVYHDESVTYYSSRSLSKYTGDVSGLDWTTESEWPCEEQAVLCEEHVDEQDRDGIGYKQVFRYEILLRGLCHMSGIWKVEIYDSSER